MKYKILWSGLADDNYYNVIAKYCIPSWTKLPGSKHIIHDAQSISIPDIKIIPWDPIPNMNSNFLKISPGKKTWAFWRKMQSQVWTVKKFKHEYDFIVLLDTDIEILNFNLNLFEKELNGFSETDLIWATGESNRRGHDSGLIILKCNHPRLDELIEYYENIWENGIIFKLEKGYDGHAVESMFPLYPSYKIKNRDYGSGLHLYDLGLVHYGSKLPKALRAEWKGDGESLIKKRLSEITIKKYKGEN